MRAIVLSRLDFREADQLITFYTKEQGKITVLATGIKKITSKNSPLLGLGALVEAEIISGKEWQRLGSVETIKNNLCVESSNPSGLLVMSALTFVNSVIKEDETDPVLFTIIFDWLYFLSTNKSVSEILLLAFFVRISAHLGWAPVLDKCVLCNTVQTKEFFSVSRGGLVCANCRLSLPVGEVVLPFNQIWGDKWRALLTDDLVELNDWPKTAGLKPFFGLVKQFIEFHTEKLLPFDW